jgi:hypothetical protein
MSVKIMEAHKDCLKDDGNLAIQQGINGGKMVNQWTAEEVANWLNSCGFQDCVQVFQAHSITGAVVPRLNPDLLREMGIQSVGRRIELQSQIVSVQAKARAQWRNEVLWAEEMYRAGPCNGVVPFGFPCCCECMTGQADVYKVTNSKINIQKHKKAVPGMGCCGFSIVSENSDLSDVKDVDVAAMTTLIGDPPGVVNININSGKIVQLTLKSSQCQKVNAIITNAKEEALIQEGLQKFGRG